MARLHTTGFELNTLTANIEFLSASANCTISTTTVRSGTYSGKVTSTASTRHGFVHQFAAAAAAGPYYFRTYFYLEVMPGGTTTIASLMNSASLSGGGIVNATMSSAGVMTLQYANGAGSVVDAPTQSSPTVTTGQWYMLDLMFDNSGGAGAAVVRARLDGVEFGSGTGLTMFANVMAFRVTTNGLAQSQSAMIVYFDDVAVNDNTGSVQNSYPGAGKVVHMLPNAAGDNNTWEKSGGAAGDTNNYQDVDEVTPDDATSYLKRITTTIKVDDFNLPTSASVGIGASDTITLVAVGARGGAISTTAGVQREVLLRIKSQASGTVLKSSNVDYSANGWVTHSDPTPKNYKLHSYTDPQAGGAWTPSLIDSMQIGIETANSSTTEVRYSTIWALVEYVPAVGGGTYTVNVNDALSIAENVTVSVVYPPGTTFTVSTNDSITISESRAIGFAISSLFDNFNDNSFDTDKWVDWSGGQVSETGGQLVINNLLNDLNYNGIDSVRRYDITNGEAFVELVDAGNQALASLEVYPLQFITDVDNRLLWGIFNGTVAAIKRVGGSNTTVYSATYDNAVHRWFKIRENNGTTYWETSADGVSWTTRASEATPLNVNGMYVELAIGTWQNSAATSATWDNFNIAATVVRSVNVNDSITISENVSITRVSTISVADEIAARGDNRRGLSFDGNDYVEIADADAFSVPTTGELTVSFWFRPNKLDFTNVEASADGPYVEYLGKGVYGGGNQFEWLFRMYNKTNSARPNRMSFYVFNINAGTGVGSFFEEAWNTTDWVHIVGKVDATKTYIYKNGTLKDSDVYTATITPQNSTAPLRIGTVTTLSHIEAEMYGLRIYNRALSDAEVLDITNGNPPSSGLVGKWDLTDGSGTTAADTSGNGRDGTLQGSTATPTWVEGNPTVQNTQLGNISVNDALSITENVNASKVYLITVTDTLRVTDGFGKALRFDGTANSYGTSSLTLPTTGFSASFWYKPYAHEASDRVIDFQDAGPTNGFTFLHSTAVANTFQFVTTNGAVETARLTFGVLNIGQWYHIGVTHNGTTARVYVDGAFVTQDTSAVFSAPTTTVTFGKRATSAGNYSNVALDEMRFFTRVLSDAEMAEHYRRVYTDNTGLVAYYTANENSGTTAADETATYNITLGSAVTRESAVDFEGPTVMLQSYNVTVTEYVRLYENDGGALDFDGTTSYGSVANHSALQIETNNKFTVSWWMTLDSYNNNILPRIWNKSSHYVAIMGDNTNGRYRNLAIEVANSSGTGNANGGVSEFWGGTELETGVLYHVTAVFDGDLASEQGKIYINGILEDMTTIFPWSGTLEGTSGGAWYVGRRPSDLTRNLDGRLDDMIVYQTALTASEVMDLYMGNPPAGYTARWKMNEGSGNTAFDSVNSNHLTLSGTTWEASNARVTNTQLGNVSVFDARTITESVTTSVQNSISVSEQITITESVTVSASSAAGYTISVNDAIAITESVAITRVSNISVSDSRSITESVTVRNTQLGNLSIVDSVAIAENITMLRASFINTSDAITITESVTAQNSQLGNISVVDSIAIAENLTVTRVSLISVSDAVAITENTTVSNTQLGNLSIVDSITVTDVPDVKPTRIISAVDAITITESLTARMDVTIAVNDSVSIKTDNTPWSVEYRSGSTATGWSGASNVFASDDSYATATIDTGSDTGLLEVTGFNFDIPSEATIEGITVEWEKKKTGGGSTMRDSAVRIIKGGVVGSTDKSLASVWPGVDTYVSYGSDSDKWGETWTPADINSPNFGAAISAIEYGGNFYNLSIDHVRVKVYYTIPVLVAVATMGPVNVNDSISITESYVVTAAWQISASDTVTVTESVSVQMSQLGNISVFDSVTVTDVPDVKPDRLISASDSVRVAESFTNYLRFYGTGGSGATDYIRVNDSPSLTTLGNNDSYSVVVRFRSTAIGDQSLSEKWGDSGANKYPWAIRGPNTGISFNIYDGSANPGAGGTGPANDGLWHTFVGVRDYNADLLRSYFDGVAKATTTDNTTGDVSTTRNIYIGARSSSFAGFNGDIAIFAVYPRVLTPTEIANMQSDIFPTGSVLFLDMDDNDNDIVTDLSGNANHGTIGRTPTWFGDSDIELNSFINTNDQVTITDVPTFSTSNIISVNDSITITESVTLMRQSFISVGDDVFMHEGFRDGLWFNGLNTRVEAPYTFPTDAFTVVFDYKTDRQLQSDNAWFFQTGSFSYSRQGVNDVQIYAHLNASGDWPGPRTLRVGRHMTQPTTDNAWHQRAVVVFVDSADNKGTVREFEDGTFIKQAKTDYTGNTDTPTGNLLMGHRYTNNNLGYRGGMSRVKIFNRKLTDAEITDVYNGVSVSGLSSYWDFREDTGTTIEDRVGSNDGTLYNNPVWIEGGQMELNSFINKNDSVSIADVPTVSNAQLGGVTVSDNILIVDIVSTEGMLSIYEWEDILSNETVTIQNTQLGNVSVVDAVSIAESALPSLTSFISKTETITISESVTSSATIGAISVNDTVQTTEVILTELHILVQASDTVLLTEYVQTSLINSVSVFDGVTITENVEAAGPHINPYHGRPNPYSTSDWRYRKGRGRYSDRANPYRSGSKY